MIDRLQNAGGTMENRVVYTGRNTFVKREKMKENIFLMAETIYCYALSQVDEYSDDWWSRLLYLSDKLYERDTPSSCMIMSCIEYLANCQNKGINPLSIPKANKEFSRLNKYYLDNKDFPVSRGSFGNKLYKETDNESKSFVFTFLRGLSNMWNN